ncbi:MAG: aspartate ammonia-lyase [Spirochaetaceae bacterium]|jgi:aspartate ammonia-lyase|nr:aspartate ammonia-lyase [Spirochaetaceae bacterium]
MRIEKDELGERSLPAGALYGLETARARDNFALDYRRVNLRLVHAFVKVKKAAALTFAKLYPGEKEKFSAVIRACDEALAGKADDAFITCALQGGAGTSTHMNVNEVLANMALILLGEKPGGYAAVHPLDDINRFQSTNDVYPTALRIAAVELLREVSDACAKLQEALQKKETAYEGIKKLGRTELMDAVPVTLGGEFGAWAQAVARDRWRLYKVEERLRQVPLGGAAAGPGIIAADGAAGDTAEAGKKTARFRSYRYGVIEELRTITGMGLAAAEYPMDLTQNCDVFVEVSGLLKALAVNLMKIAGDFRLLNSGPRGGLGEIKLAPLQKGSTIMAGKVNPVIPEMVIQLGIRVCANDTAITMAASRGELELNAFIPLIADSLLESLSLLKDGCFLFRTLCVETLVPDTGRCAELLDSSLAFAASYVPLLGYAAVSRIIAEHSGGTGEGERIRKALEHAAGAGFL